MKEGAMNRPRFGQSKGVEFTVCQGSPCLVGMGTAIRSVVAREPLYCPSSWAMCRRWFPGDEGVGVRL